MDLTDHLRDITVPTLVIAGGADEGSPERSQEMVARIPASKLLILDGAGHGPTLTRPEAIAGAMLEFFG
jgi:pimeloyl-ACP methyl ester carboxylesterase